MALLLDNRACIVNFILKIIVYTLTKVFSTIIYILLHPYPPDPLTSQSLLYGLVHTARDGKVVRE